MTFFEIAMRRMFGESDILSGQKFSDKTMLAKLDEDLRVKVSFTTLGYADHYEALRVRIINRTEGEVDSQVFKFDAILGPRNAADYLAKTIHIWTGGSEVGWYGYHPSANDLRQIVQTVTDYVSMYQSQGMEMGGMGM